MTLTAKKLKLKLSLSFVDEMEEATTKIKDLKKMQKYGLGT